MYVEKRETATGIVCICMCVCVEDNATGEPSSAPAGFGTEECCAAVVELVFGLPFEHGPLLVAAFFLGFAAQASKICVDTLLQESVEDDFRGRVFSFYDVLFNVAFVSAAALAVLVVPPDGYSPLLYGGIAVGYLITALAYRVASNRHPEPDDRPVPLSSSTPTALAPPGPPLRPRLERSRAKRRRVVTKTLQS